MLRIFLLVGTRLKHKYSKIVVELRFNRRVNFIVYWGQCSGFHIVNIISYIVSTDETWKMCEGCDINKYENIYSIFETVPLSQKIRRLK